MEELGLPLAEIDFTGDASSVSEKQKFKLAVLSELTPQARIKLMVVQLCALLALQKKLIEQQDTWCQQNSEVHVEGKLFQMTETNDQ